MNTDWEDGKNRTDRIDRMDRTMWKGKMMDSIDSTEERIGKIEAKTRDIRAGLKAKGILCVRYFFDGR